MTNGFLPPPFPLCRATDGSLSIPDPNDTEKQNHFPDLFLRLAIGIKPVTATDVPVPYDFYCPSLRNDIIGKFRASRCVYIFL